MSNPEKRIQDEAPAKETSVPMTNEKVAGDAPVAAEPET